MPGSLRSVVLSWTSRRGSPCVSHPTSGVTSDDRPRLTSLNRAVQELGREFWEWRIPTSYRTPDDVPRVEASRGLGARVRRGFPPAAGWSGLPSSVGGGRPSTFRTIRSLTRSTTG